MVSPRAINAHVDDAEIELDSGIGFLSHPWTEEEYHSEDYKHGIGGARPRVLLHADDPPGFILEVVLESDEEDFELSLSVDLDPEQASRLKSAIGGSLIGQDQEILDA